jgi:hypothetical protein
MSSPAVFTAFHDRLSTWTASPIRFENELLQDVLEVSEPQAFVYVEIYGDSLQQESFGAPGQNMWLEQGVVFLHVLVPAFSGTAQARTNANDLLNLFREKPLVAGGFSIFMPEMSIGAGNPGVDFPNHWALTASIAWRRMDITT